MSHCRLCNRTSWAEFTQVNLSKAEHEHQSAQSLRYAWAQPGAARGPPVSASVGLMAFTGVRALAEQILQDTTEDLRVQSARVEQAFGRRCEELTEAKIQLEMKLAQVGQRRELLVCVVLILPVCHFCADFGADRGPGEEHWVSGTGHSQQRGSAESGSVQTLPPLPPTKHGALQRPSAAQVGPVGSRPFTSLLSPPSSAVWKRRWGRSVPRWHRCSSS